MFATNWAEMNNLYRGPSIYASYQVSIHLAKRFQRFLEIDQPETIIAYGYSISEVKICLWWSCLLMDHAEMKNLYREPCIDASY